MPHVDFWQVRNEARERGLIVRKTGNTYGLETDHGVLMRTTLGDILELIRLPPGVLMRITR